MDTSGPEAEMRERVELMVAGGYLPLDEIRFHAADYLVGAYEELDDAHLERMAERIVEEVVDSQLEKQQGWPKTTDCDLLDTAFASLERQGILCDQNTDFTRSDCASNMARRIRREKEAGQAVAGYVFFHEQAVENAVEGSALGLSFGRVDGVADLHPDGPIGETVAARLREHGLTVAWNGDKNDVMVVQLQWQRRHPEITPPPRPLWRRIFGKQGS